MGALFPALGDVQLLLQLVAADFFLGQALGQIRLLGLPRRWHKKRPPAQLPQIHHGAVSAAGHHQLGLPDGGSQGGGRQLIDDLHMAIDLLFPLPGFALHQQGREVEIAQLLPQTALENGALGFGAA